MSAARSFRVTIRGFDFEHVYARALNHAAAKYIVAATFADAGWGTVGEGLTLITSCRLSPEAEACRVVGRFGNRPGEGSLDVPS